MVALAGPITKYAATVMDPESIVPSRALPNTFTVEEETDSAFVQLEFAFGDHLPIRGNVGVRSFETDQNSSGISSLAVGTISPAVRVTERGIWMSLTGGRPAATA